MWSFGASAMLLAIAPFVSKVVAQSSTPAVYTDAKTGIVFDSWTATGMSFGLTFPTNALSVDADEFIGYLKCTGAALGQGWCGLSFGGSMNNNLLLLAYPNNGAIQTAFKWSTGYQAPEPYTGNAKLTQISSTITATGYELIYRCQNCTKNSQGGASSGISTSAGFALIGWAVNGASPGNPECPKDVVLAQHDRQSLFGTGLTPNAANAKYSQWAALATKVVAGSCGGGGPTTTALPGPTPVPIPANAVYDYVVIGGGAGGIPIADKLSEAGKKVLLIEKGPPSTGEWGGTLKPTWLQGTKLTRFDVPGLCNQIWVDSNGIACRDTDQMAGCILGGGTAINAGLWWKPKDADWDYNFPTGWKASDMAAAVGRVFKRIPGTLTPSQDGQIYLDQGYDVVSKGLASSGWSSVNALSDANSKRKTFTKTPYMFAKGERGGPLATYLASAKKRTNFALWTNTQVKRIVRSGGHATALEVEPYQGQGYSGTVKLTANTGRVIVSVGTFGSPKVLMRSGIGPKDQLDVVASSTDGPTMIKKDDWIILPVGYNLEDHTNTDVVVSHPNVVSYDFYKAWTSPIVADRDLYLSSRSGILAQSAPNIGPVFFDEIDGADGVTRSLQWTARVEASLGNTDQRAITMSQYLGRGAKSRGHMTITSGLSTVVSDVPYLKNQDDIEAVIKGIDNLKSALSKVANLKWLSPAPGVATRDYVKNYLVATSNRRANHWIGTNKIGVADGRQGGGDAVVDLNTKVWGTDNVFVVDASIFPGMITTNPSSYIVSVSERASERILALPVAQPGAKFAQCGGQTWNGTFYCASGSTCQRKDAFYSQCL